ncbi:10 transmembrane domain, possible aa transporter, putative [Perkinsus marinus ATCC 50983]|uniref:10 transmembrane domain, possible aa transporter, putative n=1 Tax=Perkinsus marinus (strain ATCC 50983 / TXsc) TaxID=423536 RepID=C5L4X1_PERM5|nr:10 transmembrane domain, possible aa transporter, putative [Perkinsus marinus ATCC 50983]EER08191.1 10 transmembrane domain, possible aa transporter, putative [Perkinsus marinus ATCC 50983]|eukprot:XP_002776375.1 10 transmembrane domain, possible aa transporter, putative [Perkinsus marinus ATCC 50983]
MVEQADAVVELSPSSKTDSDCTVKESKPLGNNFKWWDVLAEGSEAAAAFSLMKGTLGAGALAVPYTMYGAGIIAGTILLCAMCFFTFLSVEMIVRAQDIAQKDTYEDLVEMLFGKKLGWIFQIGLFLFCFGTAAAYIVTIYDIFNPVFVAAFGSNPDTWYGIMFVDRVYFSTLVTVVILLPISLLKGIGSIRYLTMAGSVGVCFLAITAIYTLSRYGVSDAFDVDTAWTPINAGSLMSAFSTYIFAFSSQPNVPEIYVGLSNRKPSAMRRVTAVSMIVSVIVYLMVGILFFVNFGDDIASSVLISLSPMIQSGDPMVCIAFILMGVAIIGCFPLNIYPVRTTILYSLNPKKHRTIIGIVIATLTVALSFAVAVALPDVNMILGLVGAIAGSIVCFLGPGAFNIVLAKGKGNIYAWKNWWYWLMIVVGLVSLVLGTWVSLVGVIDFYSK